MGVVVDFYTSIGEQLGILEQWLRGQEPVVYRSLARNIVTHVANVPPLQLEMQALCRRVATWSEDDLRGLLGGRRDILYQPDLERQAAMAWGAWDAIGREAERSHTPIPPMLGSLAYQQTSTPSSPMDKDRRVQEFVHGLLVSPIVAYLRGFVARRATEAYLLLRYRQRLEWFDREEARRIIQDQDTRRLEQRLQVHLYAFCFDHGLPFVAEAQSPSGKLDLMALQPHGRRLLAEVKVYAPELGKTKSYVLGGYKQVLRYMSDHGEHEGYLLILNASTDELRLSDLEPGGPGLPSIPGPGSRVFVVVANVGDLESASSTDKRRLVELTLKDFHSAKTLPETPTEPP